MHDPLSSLTDHTLEQMVAAAIHSQTTVAKPSAAVFERLKTFNEYAGALEELPAAPALLYRDAGGTTVKVVLLTGAITIGKSIDCNVPYPGDIHLSRRHCGISWDDGYFILKDLKSVNGTYVTGQAEPIEEHILRDGDIFAAGQQTFAFSSGQTDGSEAPELDDT